jgi:hypothetical protein
MKPTASEIEKIGSMLKLAGITSENVYKYAA